MSNTTPPTMPCPAWCIYSAGHEFEADRDESVLWRRHDHPVRWLQFSLSDGSMPMVAVWMSQVEHAASADGPFLRRPVEIVVEGCSDTRMTGPQARQLAVALTDAADLWDAAHEWDAGTTGA